MRIVRVNLVATLLIAGLWAATQYAARELGYPENLAGRLYRGDGGSAYVPWAMLN